MERHLSVLMLLPSQSEHLWTDEAFIGINLLLVPIPTELAKSNSNLYPPLVNEMQNKEQ